MKIYFELVQVANQQNPKLDEPARPSNELLKATLIPSRGAVNPSFKLLKKPATFVSSMPSPPMTLPTEPIVFNKPQNVPSSPRNTKSPTRYREVSRVLARDRSIDSKILSIFDEINL